MSDVPADSCPACGFTPIPEGSAACPDCELALGGEDDEAKAAEDSGVVSHGGTQEEGPLLIQNIRLVFARMVFALAALLLFWFANPLAGEGRPLEGWRLPGVEALLFLVLVFVLRKEVLWIELGEVLVVKHLFGRKTIEPARIAAVELRLNRTKRNPRQEGASILSPILGESIALRIEGGQSIEIEVSPEEGARVQWWLDARRTGRS